MQFTHHSALLVSGSIVTVWIQDMSQSLLHAHLPLLCSHNEYPPPPLIFSFLNKRKALKRVPNPYTVVCFHFSYNYVLIVRLNLFFFSRVLLSVPLTVVNIVH